MNYRLSCGLFWYCKWSDTRDIVELTSQLCGSDSRCVVDCNSPWLQMHGDNQVMRCGYPTHRFQTCVLILPLPVTCRGMAHCINNNNPSNSGRWKHGVRVHDKEHRGRRQGQEENTGGEKSTKIHFEGLTGMRHKDERYRITQWYIEMCVWLKCVNSALRMHVDRISVLCKTMN